MSGEPVPEERRALMPDRTLRSLVWRAAVLVALTCAGAVPTTVYADGAWLETNTPERWNVAGAEVPPAPTFPGVLDPRAVARERAPETDEDAALADAGWRLFAPYQAGWGVRIVQAGSGYDGMGRPLGYQAFVFVDGAYAGTLAPRPMDSRTDGALGAIDLFGDVVTAQYRRYSETDPLCCPSGRATVIFKIERTDSGPTLVPESVLASVSD